MCVVCVLILVVLDDQSVFELLFMLLRENLSFPIGVDASSLN